MINDQSQAEGARYLDSSTVAQRLYPFFCNHRWGLVGLLIGRHMQAPLAAAVWPRQAAARACNLEIGSAGIILFRTDRLTVTR